MCNSEDPQFQGTTRQLVLLDGRNKYTLLKEASQVLDRYEMKFTFDEEGVSDPNSNTPKISAKFLKVAQKVFRCRLSEKKLHEVFLKQCQAEGWDTKQSHSWLSDGRLQAQTVVAAKDSLESIRSEFSRNGTRPLPCVQCRRR